MCKALLAVRQFYSDPNKADKYFRPAESRLGYNWTLPPTTLA